MKSLFAIFIFTFAILEGFSQSNGLHFDGTNDHVQTSVPPISGNSARTVECWINTTANSIPGQGGQKTIIDMGAASPNGSRFTFCLLWNNAIRLEVAGSGVSGNQAVNDGNWHHVAGVYDPNATLKFKLYVDGQLDTAANNTTAVNTSSSGNIRFGRRVDNVNYFEGSLDEVRIWNYARTDTQIVMNRNAEFCSLNDTGLIAYYTLNQGTINTNNSGVTKAFDAVAGRNGTLNGFTLSGTLSNWVKGTPITRGITLDSYSSEVCDSLVAPSGNLTWTKTGKYVDTMVNAFSCDSLIFVDLKVNNSITTSIVDTLCEPYTSPSGKYVYDESGSYRDTTLTSKGCYHFYDIDLDLTIIDTNVSIIGSEFSSDEAGASHYAWLDCEDNFTQIANTNSQQFTPTSNGSYAVRVRVDQCIDTSNCYEITWLNTSDLETSSQVQIYPNPSNGEFAILLPQVAASAEVFVRNMQGKVVHQQAFSNTDQARIELEVPAGVYFVEVRSTNDVNESFKLLIE